MVLVVSLVNVMIMKTSKELKIFRKASIEYLKRLNSKSLTYVFGLGKRTSPLGESYSRLPLLRRSRQSLKRFAREMNIFKAPVIDGLQIMYYRTYSYVFEKFHSEPSFEMGQDMEWDFRDKR